MEFSSILFIICFLPLSLLSYYLVPKQHKVKTLLIISSVYCGFISLNLLAIVYVYITLNYYIALVLSHKWQKKRLSLLLYVATQIINLSLFILFRLVPMESVIPSYYNNNFLPICISFFVLQLMGYISEVYKNQIPVERVYQNFALYILFYPKFMLGPLVRYPEFLIHLKRKSKLGLSTLGKGLNMFIIGLAKKVILGDNVYGLFKAVNNIEIENLPLLTAWLGLLGYLLGFYFVLSGTLDMANGLAYCFGFKFDENFDHPIFTTSITDFCSRWHISTVKYFEKYMKPMKIRLRKHSILKNVYPIMLWCLMGLWYEFSINRLIWGLLLGIMLVLETLPSIKKIPVYIASVLTFIINSICWVFFSTESITEALKYLLSLIGFNNGIVNDGSLYLIRSYIVILLVAVYASTDLFKNLIEKIKDKIWAVTLFEIAIPILNFVLFIISISLIVGKVH